MRTYLRRWTFQLWLFALLCWTGTATAQEFYLLGGAINESGTTDRSYAWSLEYMQVLGEYTAVSLSWLNEGHLPNNHRDGPTVQLWGSTKRIDNRFVLAAGIGPYYYFDTELAKQGRGFSDSHGWGGVLSLAGFWYTESPWVIQLRANFVKTNDIDTYSAMVGVGYQLDFSPARGPSSAGPPRAKATDNEIAAFIGLTIVNSANSQQSTAQSLEYRRGVARYIDWTIAWLNEGDNRLIRRNGILSQAWLVRGFFDEHLTLGVGLGPYVLVDKHSSPRNKQDTDTLAGVLTLSASYRFNPRWLVRLSWNRIATTYNRDTDVIMIGPGYRF